MPGIPINTLTTTAEIHKSQNLYKNRPSTTTKGKYQGKTKPNITVVAATLIHPT